jgi:hypothetical protein
VDDDRVELLLHELARRVRQQHLAAVAGRADACGTVDAEADIALAADGRLPRVQTHPHLHLGAVRPLLHCESALRDDCRSKCVVRAGEDEEERVALIVDLPASMGRRGFAQNPGMALEDRAVALTEPLEQPG